VTVCGESDVMDDKLYVELHVFEYESLSNFIEPVTNTPSTSISPSKRSRLSRLTKETINTPPASNSTKQKTDETTTEHQPNNDTNENRPSEHTTNAKQSAEFYSRTGNLDD